MFRLWAKTFKDSKMTADTTICNANDESRTQKVFHAITDICQQFDLSEPIWLETNIKDFQRTAKTRFNSDNFIDSIDFDYLEIQIIEEDW